ncbi:EpsG family protein [Shewanella sp.]|uniref:EpsG family protein n=1 Tax=Shewanella sp. TaxID=50422 RepID=UPI003D1412E3
MVYYSLLYFTFVITLLFSVRFKHSYFYYCSALLLAIFASVREFVGVDYKEYSELFPLVASGANTQFEIANNFLITVFYNLSGINAVFAFYSIATILIIAYSLTKISPSKELSLFIFVFLTLFYLATFNHIRQWLAISIIMLGYGYLLEERNKSFFICILVAPFFHLSVIFLSLFSLLLRYRLKEKLIQLITIGGCIFGMFGFKVLEYTKYKVYLHEFGTFYFTYFVLFVFSLLQYFLFKKLKNKIHPFHYYIVNSLLLLFLSISLMVLYVGPPTLDGMRLMETIFWIELVSIPYLIHLFERKSKILVTLVFMSFLVFYNITIMTSKGHDYKLLPFKSFIF